MKSSGVVAPSASCVANAQKASGADADARAEPLPVYSRLSSVSIPVTGVEIGISGIRTADVTTSHAGARPTPAEFVA